MPFPQFPQFLMTRYLRISGTYRIPVAIGTNLAWNTTTGSDGTVIAVRDTGVRFDHPDFARAAMAGKLLPGYDFISADSGSPPRAND